MSTHQKQRAIMRGQTKGMVNGFICPDLHIIITKNMDDGFIPERIACPVCGAQSVTMMYLVNQTLDHCIEWYRPTEAQTQAAELSMDKKQVASNRDYLTKGGLISREKKLPSFTS